MMDLAKLKYFNFIYFSNTIDIGFIKESRILPALVKWVAKSGLFTYHALRKLFTSPNAYRAKGKIIFFTISKNNYLSVEPLYKKLATTEVAIFGDRKFDATTPIFIPTVLSALLVVVFFPRLMVDYMMMDQSARKSFRQGISDVLLSYPFYYVCFLWFKWTRPRAIVIVNDHVYSTRILVYWANKFNIPSFYLQHASVTEGFPKLDMMYAFLEGEDAMTKYIKAGSDRAKISLIGIPKLDEYYHRISSTKRINTIGIASNGLEPLDRIYELILFIHENFPEQQVFYRPHLTESYDGARKSERDQFFARINELKKKVLISDPFKQNAMEYLTQIDCLIAGDSGIHLEAVWLNVTSIYFRNGGYFFDYYGFVKRKLVHYAETFEELKIFLLAQRDDRTAVRHQAKFYCDTIHSQHDGNSTELAANLLQEKARSIHRQ
jgi:hypothetical protein